MRELCRLAAGALAALLLLRAFLLGGGDPRMALLCAVAGVVAATALAFWSEGWTTFSAAALATAYAFALTLGGVGLDAGVPVVAALLALYLETADLGMSVPPGTPLDPSFVRSRLRRLAVVLAVAVSGAAGILLAAALPASGSPALRALGMLGAVVALGVPVLLLRPGGGNPGGPRP